MFSMFDGKCSGTRFLLNAGVYQLRKGGTPHWEQYDKAGSLRRKVTVNERHLLPEQ